MTSASAPAVAAYKKTIVFVEPPYTMWDRSMDRLRQGEETIPGMGPLVLAAVARQKGYRSKILDAKKGGISEEDVARQVAAMTPDHVGFSATTISIHNAARIAARIKELVPGVVTTVGGPHVSAIPERTLESFPSFDYGVVGEGEISYFDLLERLGKGAPTELVPGLVFRSKDRVFANARAPYIEALDELPEPAWDLLDNFPHHFHPSIFNYKTTPVGTLVTSRGCPFSCVFCDRSTSGREGRMHSVPYVIKLLERLKGMGVRHVLFYDDLFTVKKSRVRDLCERMIELKLDLSWSCNSHPNLLDLDTMRLMKRAGCWQIAYGIESGSQTVLDHVKREVRLPRMIETLRLTQEAGIRAKGMMMIAHPVETEQTLEETRQFLRTVPMDLAQITKFTPYPGTPAYATIREKGTFHEDWERMNAMNFTFVPNGLSEERLEQWFDVLYRTFYRRRDIVWKLVKIFAAEPRYLRRFLSYAKVYVSQRMLRRNPRPPKEMAACTA